VSLQSSFFNRSKFQIDSTLFSVFKKENRLSTKKKKEQGKHANDQEKKSKKSRSRPSYRPRK